MGARCIFVFFMIFNAILGLSGIINIVAGIITATQSSKVAGASTASIANIVLGVYITTILVLGACSWKKTGVLIAYFVLTILLILSEIAVIVILKVGTNVPGINPSAGSAFDLALIVFGISLGIAFLSFLFSAIYFCLMRKEDGPQLYSDVKNMEYTNMPSYQNV